MSSTLWRRLAALPPLLLLVAVIVFMALRLAGIDPLAYLAEDPLASPADKALLRARYGLDDPLPLQFVTWLIGDDWLLRDRDGDGAPDAPGERRGVLRGDLGVSLNYNRPVGEVIAQHLPNTLLLGGSALIVTLTLALLLGVASALRPDSWWDRLLGGAALITYSMPIFLIALLAVQLFAVQAKAWHDAGASWLPYLPTGGMRDVRGGGGPEDLLRHMLLPVACLAAVNVAGYSRYLRASLLEALAADYVRTARAKGLTERRVVGVHALKNAALPLLTLVGLDAPFILAGAVVTETIFAWPGMGRLYITSLEPLDPPLVMALVLMIALAVMLAQVVVDGLAAWLDPRISYR